MFNLSELHSSELTLKNPYFKSKAWKPRICRMGDQQQRISSPFILSFQNLLQKVTDKSLLTCGEGSDVDLAEKNVSPFRNSKHVEIPKKWVRKLFKVVLGSENLKLD